MSTGPGTGLERLIDPARQLGGNAVLGCGSLLDLGNGWREIVAYGTAALVRPA